jgi:hypothetical protein
MTLFRMIFLALAVLMIGFPFAGRAEETRFFSLLSDIPLMPELYEVTKDSMSFDKPEGRIVEAVAASETQNINQIRAFYESTLPQLGWTAKGPYSYVREGETLSLRLESRGTLNIVHLSLSPKG